MIDTAFSKESDQKEITGLVKVLEGDDFNTLAEMVSDRFSNRINY